MKLDLVITHGLKLIGVFLLVLLNGFFVAAEFALVKVRRTQLDGMAAKGNRRARMVQQLISRLDAALSATQLGITSASLALGWVGEPVFFAILAPLFQSLHVQSSKVSHTLAFIFGFSAITFLHIVAGELAPKYMAIKNPVGTSMLAAYPLHWFYRITYPFIRIINVSANWLLRRLGLDPQAGSELVHSEEELRLMFSATHEQTASTRVGREVVLNALDLRRRIARDVMRPRQEIVFVDNEASMTECLDLAEKTRFSRFPICESGNVDKTLGVVHVKDLYAMRIKARTGADLLPVARPIIYIPETAHLEKVLQLFLDRKLHFAIVIDEFGGTRGLLTLENILEELVGQIQDEFDQEKSPLLKTGERTWEILGSLPLHELSSLVGQSLAEEGISTSSGWVTHRLGGFPKKGDVLTVGNFRIRVEEMAGMRVERLTVEQLEPAAESPVT